jgi:hypothetical protein
MRFNYVFRSLVFLGLSVLLASCQGANENSNETLEVRYLTEGIQELADGTRGSIEVNSVDYICGYARTIDERGFEVGADICAYFIEYKRSNSSDSSYAVSAVGFVYGKRPDGTEILSDQIKDLTILTSVQQLDREYATASSLITSILDSVLTNSSSVIESESDVTRGDISRAVITRTMRSINQS